MTDCRIDTALGVTTFLNTNGAALAPNQMPLSYFNDNDILLPSVVLYPEGNAQIINLKDIPPGLTKGPADEAKPFSIVAKDLNSLSDGFIDLCVKLNKHVGSKTLNFAFVFEPNNRYFALFQMETKSDRRDEVKWPELDHKVLGNAFKAIRTKNIKSIKAPKEQRLMPFIDVPPAEMMIKGAIKITLKRQIIGVSSAVFVMGKELPYSQSQQAKLLARKIYNTFGCVLENTLNCPLDLEVNEMVCPLDCVGTLLKDNKIKTLGQLRNEFRG